MRLARASSAPSTNKRPLSIFEFPLQSWEEFCVIKLLADLVERGARAVIIDLNQDMGQALAQDRMPRTSRTSPRMREASRSG